MIIICDNDDDVDDYDVSTYLALFSSKKSRCSSNDHHHDRHKKSKRVPIVTCNDGTQATK